MLKKIKYLLLFSILFISFLTYSQSEDKLKNEALQFSLEVVKTYFQDDCNAYLNKISDTIILISGQSFYQKNKIKTRLCESFAKAVEVKSKKFNNYQEIYKYEVISIKDFFLKNNLKSTKYLKPIDSDFLFAGGNIKDSKSISESFIFNDMYFFMVRKVNGKWFLKGIRE